MIKLEFNKFKINKIIVLNVYVKSQIVGIKKSYFVKNFSDSNS